MWLTFRKHGSGCLVGNTGRVATGTMGAPAPVGERGGSVDEGGGSDELWDRTKSRPSRTC